MWIRSPSFNLKGGKVLIGCLPPAGSAPPCPTSQCVSRLHMTWAETVQFDILSMLILAVQIWNWEGTNLADGVACKHFLLQFMFVLFSVSKRQDGGIKIRHDQVHLHPTLKSLGMPPNWLWNHFTWLDCHECRDFKHTCESVDTYLLGIADPLLLVGMLIMTMRCNSAV